jgi:SNW domain-containing protein 1
MSIVPSDPLLSLTSRRVQTSEEIQKRILKTQAALEAKLGTQGIKHGATAVVAPSGPRYVRYTANQQAPGHNASCAQRIIRIEEAEVDPLEPSKFKHKKVR